MTTSLHMNTSLDLTYIHDNQSIHNFCQFTHDNYQPGYDYHFRHDCPDRDIKTVALIWTRVYSTRLITIICRGWYNISAFTNRADIIICIYLLSAVMILVSYDCVQHNDRSHIAFVLQFCMITSISGNYFFKT